MLVRRSGIADLNAQGVGTLLLADISDLFAAGGRDKLPSSNLTESLAAIEGRPWAEWESTGSQFRRISLPTNWGRFGVSPRTIRIGDETPRGYVLDDFREAFER